MKTRQQGLNLIELMVTLAVLAVLFGIGLPKFNSTILNNRSTALANELITAANFARSEAVKRGVCVDLCASEDGKTCSGKWTDGWIVRLVDDKKEVLRIWDPPRKGAVILLDGNAGGGLRFAPLGDLAVFDANNPTTCSTRASNPAVITSYFDKCQGRQARKINIAVSGRISVNRVECP